MKATDERGLAAFHGDPGQWKRDVIHVARFGWHVLRRFHLHRGLLLSGAVAYNVLLSIIPLGAIFLVSLSHLVDSEGVVQVFSAELERVLPGKATALTDEIQRFWVNRDLIGGLSLALLLFFGSVAFRVLGDAMAAVFSDVRRISSRVRGFVTAMLIPFLYVGVVSAGLILLTFVSIFLGRFSDRWSGASGPDLSLYASQRWALWIGSLAGELLLFTSIYMILPGIKIRARDAIVAGGLVTLLWELTRRLLGWYFASVSTVGLVYGSLTTVVVTLMSAEIAAVLLLLGAQVVAELTYARETGIPWFELHRRGYRQPAPPPALSSTRRI